MTTEAQIAANRANAQKSTGPRTPEGKEKASRNALTHGLLAKDVVVGGEDLEEFDLFRNQYRAELAPVGIAESLLAERIVGLSWRLQRAERSHTESFDVMYAHCAADPQIKRRWPNPDPEQADPIFGETVVKDFSQTKVLDRLMMYERRIETCLYRTMGELRQVQERRQGVAGGPQGDRRSRRSRAQDRGGPFHRVPEIRPPDFTLENLLAKIAASEEGPQTREDAFGNPDTPADATTNTPEAEGQSCDNVSLPGVVPATKPMEEEVSSLKCEISSEASQAASPQSLPTSDFTLRTSDGTPTVQIPSCETNPICGAPGEGQSLCGTGVRSNPALSTSGETKPIPTGASTGQFGYRPIFRRRR